MSKISVDRQFRKIEISEDNTVKVSFREILTLPPDHPENDNPIKVRKYTVESDDVPHDDLIDLLKKLKVHALAINEMEVDDAKKKGDYQVTTVQIDGDVLLQKSRVKFVISKTVNRTGKIIPIKTCQTTMYGDSDYAEHEKMSKILEELIEEVWLYLTGKSGEEIEGQLPLFSPLQLEPL